ncbi:MAG: hypothetical protein AAF960_02220 [Bacteroidota bacterium]
MKRIIFLLFCFSFFTQCQPNEKPKAFTGDRQFQANDPSRLYFKNIRSIAYYRTRKPHSKIDIYKFRKLDMTDKRPILYPMILDNWMDEEAYIFLEKNAYSKFGDPLTIKATAQDSTENILTIDVFNKKNQYTFAEQVFEALQSKQDLSVLTKDSSYIPIFANYKDKSAFVITMKDYYRLIDLDRKEKKRS